MGRCNNNIWCTVSFSHFLRDHQAQKAEQDMMVNQEERYIQQHIYDTCTYLAICILKILLSFVIERDHLVIEDLLVLMDQSDFL